MGKKDYIVVTASENDDIPDTAHVHYEDESASLRTMHNHGVTIEKNREPAKEDGLSYETTRAFLSKSGVEVAEAKDDIA
jgi:chromosome segregation and condensation protein ScpB